MAQDRSILWTVAGILAVLAISVWLLEQAGMLKYPTTVPLSVPSVANNGEYTEFGVANSQLQSPFYSLYAITPAKLSGNSYVNGSAVFAIATNSTYNPNTELATIVFQLSGPVSSMQLTATPNFNNSAITSSEIIVPSVEIVSYPSNQIVFGPEAMTIGQTLDTGAIPAGQYALEITTQNTAPITLKGASTVVAGLFKLGTQLVTSSTGVTSSSNFAFAWED